MKCLIPNGCEDKQLCCTFCKKKRCSERCLCKYDGCVFFNDEKYERKGKKEEK